MSPLPPLAIGFFGLGTGYYVYGDGNFSEFPGKQTKRLARYWVSGASGCPASCSS